MSAYFTYPITRFSFRFTGIIFLSHSFLFLFLLATESALLGVIQIVHFGIFLGLSLLLSIITIAIGCGHFRDYAQFASAILLQVLNSLAAFLYLKISFIF